MEDRDVIAEAVQEAMETLPKELAAKIDNVAVAIADELHGRPGVLGLYEGFPLTRRGGGYLMTLPDRITIFRRPLERLFGHDPERLRAETIHTVHHEIAHHFGISDDRLREIDRY
jgi:predicted Zn-dependent protease with MMP-like domain